MAEEGASGEPGILAEEPALSPICSEAWIDPGDRAGPVAIDGLGACDPDDPFDPRNWDRMFADSEAQEWRLYLDDNAQTWVILDQVDWLWAVQWKWTTCKPHPTRHDKKMYARRSPGYGGHYKPNLYLHVEIQKRVCERPSEHHKHVDHRNGNEYDCRRKNLRWATTKENCNTSRRRI